VHDSQVLLTPPGDLDDVENPVPLIELVELDDEAGVWAGAFPGCPDAYGSAGEVIAALTSRSPDDPWVREVTAALGRDRKWARWWGTDTGRLRPHLEIVRGRGTRVHATAAENRESVYRYGLDWNRMGSAPGIAGSTRPELPAIFVCEDLDEVSFFLRMARVPTDIWSVDVEGIWLENGPAGWEVISHPVATERLTLLVRDIPAGGFNADPPENPERRRVAKPTSGRGAEAKQQPRRSESGNLSASLDAWLRMFRSRSLCFANDLYRST
jgi:hypothetical protein